MRCVLLARVSGVVAAALFAAVSVVVAQDRPAAAGAGAPTGTRTAAPATPAAAPATELTGASATQASAWSEGPELRPGEIVIKRTGRTKRVVAAKPAPAAATSATSAAPAGAERPAELSHDGPGPRVVTIGYLVREPMETGWGPQVHCPAPGYSGYSSSYCDSYGYNSYVSPCPPSFFPSFGSGFFGSSSYCIPSPLSSATRR